MRIHLDDHTYADLGHESVIEIGGAWRTARIPHRCACGKSIRPGTRYLRKALKVEGEVITVKEAFHIHRHEEEEWALDQLANQR